MKNIKKINIILIIFFGLMVFGALYFLVWLPKAKNSAKNNELQKEVADYSFYKDYQFSKDKNVIDFGVQPLWFPASLITVLMENDIILQKELSDLGYVLKTHQFLKGEDVNHFIASGDLEIGVSGDMPTIRAVLNNDFKVISLVQQGFVGMVSRDILEIQDLKNKKIAYPYGSVAHYYLLNTLKKNGLSELDVKLVPMNIISMNKALQDGVVDAFTAWEPTLVMATTNNPNFTIAHRGRSYGFLSIKESLIKESPEMVKLLIASQTRSLQWLKKNNAHLLFANKLANIGGKKLFKEYVYINEEQIYKIAKEDLPGIYTEMYPKIDPYLVSARGDIGKEFLFLQELGFVDKKFTLEDLQKKFDFDLIMEVVRDPEKYKLFEDLKF